MAYLRKLNVTVNECSVIKERPKTPTTVLLGKIRAAAKYEIDGWGSEEHLYADRSKSVLSDLGYEVDFDLLEGISGTQSITVYKLNQTPNGVVKDVVPFNSAKGSIYESVIIDGIPILVHTLIMLMAHPDFYDLYMSNKSLVINHTVEEEFGKWINNHYYSTRPHRDALYNPEYLELVDYSNNNKHGHFIKEFGLQNVFVKAEDVDYLRAYKELVPVSEYDEGDMLWHDNRAKALHNRSLVSKLYETNGIDTPSRLRF